MPVPPCFVALPDGNDAEEDAGDTEDDVCSCSCEVGGHDAGFKAVQK